jgi:hypothetical protein
MPLLSKLIGAFKEARLPIWKPISRIGIKRVA